MPNSGPRPSAYEVAEERVNVKTDSPYNSSNLPFALVDLDAPSAHVLEQNPEQSFFKGTFSDRRDAADIRIGLGDVIRITIFEAGAGGLFVPTGGTLNSGNYVSIPDQEVDRTGTISVPYAAVDNDGGIINVYNRRPVEVQREIEQRLVDRAIEPQVIVTVTNRTSNLYSVIGNVKDPGRYGVTHSGVRVLDAISAAGGPKSAPYNTLVTLQREGSSTSVHMSTLLKDPENNIYIQPNDIISVKQEDRFFNIYGATDKNDRIAFDAESLSLADAIAKSGGFDDTLADPSMVVLYRMESPDTLQEMGATLKSFEKMNEVPTVYRLDISKADGYFLAQKLALRDDDMIYVSNRPLTDLSKLVTLLRDVLLVRLID